VHEAEWIANVVLVPKKDGKVRMCADFRDLNKVCPKDDFPLPHIDVLVDNTAGSALMSFMDGFSRYNLIKMAPRDKSKITEWGIYCYTVMSIGLKNVGTTNQKMATALLHDKMHNEVEVYVDDMILKSKEREGHITNLRKLFERIKEYRLRLNPQKCTFEVTAGKLLGFLVNDRGVEVNPSKINAILGIPTSVLLGPPVLFDNMLVCPFFFLTCFVCPRLAPFVSMFSACIPYLLCFFLCLSTSLFLLSLHVHAWSMDAWSKGATSLAQAKRVRM